MNANTTRFVKGIKNDPTKEQEAKLWKTCSDWWGSLGWWANKEGNGEQYQWGVGRGKGGGGTREGLTLRPKRLVVEGRCGWSASLGVWRCSRKRASCPTQSLTASSSFRTWPSIARVFLSPPPASRCTRHHSAPTATHSHTPVWLCGGRELTMTSGSYSELTLWRARVNNDVWQLLRVNSVADES